MTTEQYNELKTMAQERLLPLVNHARGRYLDVDNCLWGDGEKCGQECGFYALAKLGWVYNKTVQVYMTNDYAEKKAELGKHIAEAEAAASKATPTYGISLGWSDNKCDKEIGGDGINPYACLL